MRAFNKRQFTGWLAVGISTLVTTFWAFWGIIENFHEGWYYESWLANVGLMFIQYLSPMLIFMGLTATAIYQPCVGGALHGILALLAIWFFQAFSQAATFLLILPLAGLGALYWFGEIPARKKALRLVVGLPLLTLIAAGIEPVWRVSQRLDDGNLQARLVQGNEVALIWAPDGPGWPHQGGDWHEAQAACQYLNAEGLHLAETPQHIWRLPTVAEAVGSMARHGRNSGGEWQANTAQASYETRPDKESPLWNVYSPVIYWWTTTEVDQTRAYMIAYDGQVWPRTKAFGPAYLGFRCVKRP